MSLEELRKEIEAGNVLLLVGSGVSSGATKSNPLASWKGLILNGIEVCEDVVGVPTEKANVYRKLLNLKSAEPEEFVTVAEFVTTKLGGSKDGRFKKWLRDSVGNLKIEYPDALEALRDLPVLIATTNYDRLIEEVTKKESVTWRQSNDVERVLNGVMKGIIHLHGDWKDSESVVLGIRSYEKILADQHAQTILKTILTTKTIIFVGFGEGLDDPNFGALLEWASPVFSGSERMHYRLARQKDVAKLREQHNRNRDRIQVVSYGTEFSDLAPFLRSLKPGSAPTTPGSGGGGNNSVKGTVDARRDFPKLDDPTVARPFRNMSALRALAKLLQEARLHWETLSRMFWQSVPKSWVGELAEDSAEGAERYANLVDVLSRFGSQATQDRNYPLIEFVLRLALHPECAKIETDLRDWLRKNSFIVNVDTTVMTELEHRLIGALYLLVKLECADNETFRIKAWLGDDTGTSLQPLVDDNEIPRTKVESFLGRLWTQRLLRERLPIIGEPKLTVEFILPRELLTLDVDEWEVPPGDGPLGIRCRVVVRPLERVYAAVRVDLEDDGNFHGAQQRWQRKWHVFRHETEEVAPVLVESPDDHERQMALSAKLLPDKVVCLALALTSYHCSEETQQNMVWLSIKQGVPIALWSRQKNKESEAFQSFLSTLVSKIRELPEAVREARRSAVAASQDGDCGHCISLLWDDANRIPPDAQVGSDLYIRRTRT